MPNTLRKAWDVYVNFDVRISLNVFVNISTLITYDNIGMRIALNRRKL